jgi:hypothetical protein
MSKTEEPRHRLGSYFPAFIARSNLKSGEQFMHAIALCNVTRADEVRESLSQGRSLCSNQHYLQLPPSFQNLRRDQVAAFGLGLIWKEHGGWLSGQGSAHGIPGRDVHNLPAMHLELARGLANETNCASYNQTRLPRSCNPTMKKL